MIRKIAVLLPPSSYALQLYNDWLRSRGLPNEVRALVPQLFGPIFHPIEAVPLTAPGAGVRGERFDEIVILAPDIDYNLFSEAMKTLGGMP